MSYSSKLLDAHLSDHYSPYSQPDSPSPDEDENASLRSQALNADGTPKRPMNAFMIFARRRRPQVSAANQMMRTGEISKILSKEWNTMPMSDKQFYLDQAKKLKENFNAKYPDYVYRRRPNNSRKKRRTDASTRGVDAYGDPRDDSLSPHEDYPHGPSVSPIDALVPNDSSVSLAAHQYRLPYSAHPHYHNDPAAPPPPPSVYPYYSPSHHSSSRHQYDPLHASASFPPTAPGAHSTHSPSIYNPDDDLLGGSAAAAAFPRLEPIKLEHAWGSGLSTRRGALHPAPLRNSSTGSSHHHHQHSHHSHHSHHGGGGGGGSGGSSSTSSSHHHHHAHHGRHWSDGSGSAASPSAPSFPTLVAPFYPSSGTVSPSTASSSSAASYFGGAGAAAERDSFDQTHAAAPTAASSQAHSASSHGSSPSFPALHHPRAYSGPTLGSTLALSPAATAPGLWSSVRTGTAAAAAAAAAGKSDL